MKYDVDLLAGARDRLLVQEIAGLDLAGVREWGNGIMRAGKDLMNSRDGEGHRPPQIGRRSRDEVVEHAHRLTSAH